MPAAQKYFEKALSNSSHRSYKSAHTRFINFCSRYSITPFPLSETILCSFATFLAEEGLKLQTIKCYLSGLRFAQLANGFPDPQIGLNCPRLECIIRGIKRSQAEANVASRTRLPITPDILAIIQKSLPFSSDGTMIWAACCLGFFGFLRAAEFTVPSLTDYDPTVHLSLSDVSLDSHSNPSVLRVHIKQSKTDPFRHGVDIFVGKTLSSICPVSALTAYLVVRGPQPGPLFLFRDGSTLSRQKLVLQVRECLKAGGVNEALYCGHSFRIGAATTAAKKGLEDSLIQTLGRWQSSAYLRYIKLPRESLSAISKLLVA